MNTRAVLRNLPQGKSFRVDANGRIKPKNNNVQQNENPQNVNTENQHIRRNYKKEPNRQLCKPAWPRIYKFLNESKFCVLNGRFADGDNYTSISKKGKAVVDFICVPQDMFTDVKYFRVLTVQSIVDDFKLHDLIGSKSKLPDHSAIVSEFNITRHCLATQTKNTRSSCSRFKLNQIPLDFMTSDIKRTALLNLIEQIERCRETQDNVDKIYTELCSIIFSEMTDKIPKVEFNGSKKRFKQKKNRIGMAQLMDLWNKMTIKEKEFTRWKARDMFDKTLRRTERAYRRMKAVDIESMTTKNPNDFWEKIRNLGPRNFKTIPVEIVDKWRNLKGKSKQTEFNFTVDRNQLELVNEYKYLGITFSYNGSFLSNVDLLAKSGGRALGNIIAKIHNIKDFGYKSYEKLFNSCIVPILYYSCVWGYRKYQSKDNIQNRAIRYYLGVHRFAPILAIHGDIGWIPSQYRRWINMVRYWNRLIRFDNNRITKLAFNIDYDRCKSN
ncbi:Hypothetical predicted protein [Mytilus galloprovincialis]|uniref:Endonuclease/exonuclease/phosphatase domain-containing protein n=1 Tax=Mytilus galloprovincialis TaxID=29158 RepID=A0A8B6C0R1_MYTGA|nr:Hypothetical predicted protein [Mytilus galloprovincialis]